MSSNATAVVGFSEHDLLAIQQVMQAAGVALQGSLKAEFIAGGRSNLTFRLTDGSSAWVIRTPPRLGRTPSAHDIAREYRVTEALWATQVPVPRPVTLCEDEGKIGGAFAIWDFVPGRTIQRKDQLDQLSDEAVAATSTELIETLAALHRVDHVTVGLERFGRPSGYAQRQLKRWAGQWQLVGPSDLGTLAAGIIGRLSASIPPQRATSIVHGDYRIDNTILDPVGTSVAAVVDWELSTVGDPVADVAMMCAYRHRAFDLIVGAPSAWTSQRLPDVEALATAYEAAGGAELADWAFHLGLAYFKIGVIAAGIDYRSRAGAVSGSGFDTAGESIATYLQLAAESLGGAR
ncbi:phosphotransferase family protein [Dactylosporangium sp. CA-233914]|uniref:phosphotransferase family protein n=1 Tax=Dactylosporangium sp. CA-233914 TaxID=3239934 RepID=UPI003D92120F